MWNIINIVAEEHFSSENKYSGIVVNDKVLKCHRPLLLLPEESNLNDSVMNSEDQLQLSPEKTTPERVKWIYYCLLCAVSYHTDWWAVLQSNQLINSLRNFSICLKMFT